MPGREDFGSNSRSPGGWGGSAGNSGMGGMGGQKASTYNYYGGAGRKNPAIGNWNTGGAQMGRGNQYDVRDPLGNRIGGAMGPTDRFGFNSVMGLGRSPFVRQPQQPAPAAPSLLGSPVSWTPPAVTQEDIPGVVEPGIAPQGMQFYEGMTPGANNPFVRQFPANPGGQFGPRTYNDGYQTMRSDKFQNNPAYGSPGGGLGQYNRQTTMAMTGGPGGYHFGYGGPR